MVRNSLINRLPPNNYLAKNDLSMLFSALKASFILRYSNFSAADSICFSSAIFLKLNTFSSSLIFRPISCSYCRLIREISICKLSICLRWNSVWCWESELWSAFAKLDLESREIGDEEIVSLETNDELILQTPLPLFGLALIGSDVVFISSVEAVLDAFGNVLVLLWMLLFTEEEPKST